MSIDVLDIVAQARVTLIDTDSVTWDDSELIEYFNRGVQAACNIKPDLHVVTQLIELAAGAKQILPENGLQLFDIVYDATSESAVTQVQRQLLGDSRPNWLSMTPTASVRHFMADNDNVKTFWVYPPNNGSGEVMAVFGAVPDEVTGTPYTSPLELNYSPAMHAYICSLALAKNTKRQDLTKSAQWMQTFVSLISGKTQTQLAVAPKATQLKQD